MSKQDQVLSALSLCFFPLIKGVKSPVQDAQLVKTVRRSRFRAGGLKAAKFGSQVFTPQGVNSNPKVKEP